MKLDDRYQILEKIGAGSYATVYRAKDCELGREVAIKQIHQQFLADPKLLDRYWAEAQLLASLQHPNIVTIFDIVRERGWLVMELMQANLRDRLQGRQMDLKSLKTTVAHCLRALKYLHARGIIHGDIKPSNLMIDHRRRVKLGDFGFARRVSDEEGSLLKGTAKYIAPEVVSEEFGEVGPQSDLYSLGFSAYELMCGTEHFEQLFPGLSAFARDKQAAWMMWHAAADRRLPDIHRVLEGVPEDLAAVIHGLIEKDRRKRYQTADEALSDLHVDLKIVKSGEEQEPIEEPVDPQRKRRLILMGAFAASLCLSLAMLFLPDRPPQGPDRAQNKVGIVRSVDAPRKSLEYEDPIEGLPRELVLTEASRIKLIQPGEQPRYVLPREIEPGSWIEIERTRDRETGGEVIHLVVARPIVSPGLVKHVNTAEGRVTVAVTEGKVRADLDLYIPPRAKLQLNGQPTILNQLRPDDRVEVTHLLDPAGRRGHIAAALSAWRREQGLKAYIDRFDPAAKKLFARMGTPDGPVRQFSLDETTRLRLATGDPLRPEDLQAGDYAQLTADTHAYEIVVTRHLERAAGAVIAVNPSRGLLTVQTDAGGQLLNLMIGPDCPITLGQKPARLEDLRPEFDRVTVHYSPAESSVLTAAAVDAVRPPRHDRWGAILSTRAYSDRALSPLRYATEDGQLLYDVLISRYAFDPPWLLNLMDQNMGKVRQTLTEELRRVGRTTQVIVAVFGHAYLGDDGKVYLALKDFNSQNMAATGLPLDELVELLEQCPATDKLLLLDVVHAGNTPDLARQPPLPELLSHLSVVPKTTRILGAAGAEQRGHDWPERQHGVFAHFLAEAFRGPADVDRNLRLTADELIRFLTEQMSAAALPGGVQQTPYLHAP